MLLDRRMVFVTGKGGVGKTAVASALGMVAARQGLRTVVAEVAQRDDVHRALSGGEGGWEEVELQPNLFAVSVDPQRAMEEYLNDQLSRPLAEVLASSRVFGYLAAATPGMRELLTVGKLWELAQDERRAAGGEPYDLVVVDAPATGHGLALLDAPRTFADVAAVGPIARQARIIHDTLSDPALTGVVAVSTAAEMPVNETRYLAEQLGDRLDLVVANAVRPDRFSDAEAERLARLADRLGVRAALDAHGRSREQRAQLERLGADVVLPFAVTPADGAADLDRLADALAVGLGSLG